MISKPCARPPRSRFRGVWSPVNVAVVSRPTMSTFVATPTGDVARCLGHDRRWRIGRLLFRDAVHAQSPRHPAAPAEGQIATVYTWPGGAISLWPVPNVEETRIACWKSARAASSCPRKMGTTVLEQ